MASSAPSRRAAASLLASLRAATPATRCPNPAVPSTRTGQRGVDRRGFASWASTPSPASGVAWMTSRVKELKDAARAQMDAARVAPERLKSAARESVRRRLASALGPRAAESIMSGTLSLNPATHARNLTLRARAFGFRHRAPIVAVAGTGATYATYAAAIAAAERLRGRGDDDDDAQKRGIDATVFALSAGCVALTATYLRARSVVNPERVHAAVMRRLERHPGLVEVLGAPVVSSEHRAVAKWAR